MVQMTDPDLGDTIYDPASGTAGFLIDAVDHILARYSEEPVEVPIYGEDWLEKCGQTLEGARKEIPKLQTYKKGAGERLPDWGRLEASSHGTDVSRQMMRISMMNLVLHGIRGARLERANVLSEMSGLTEDDLHRCYKVILSNPPFAGQIPKESVRADLPTKSKQSELLFLALFLRLLQTGGRAAVIVPDGVLFGSSKAHKTLRKMLVEEQKLDAIVSMPSGVFKPYAGVSTAILLFTKTNSGGTDHVWFYDMRADGFSLDDKRSPQPDKNDLADILARWQQRDAEGERAQTDQSFLVPKAEIADNDYDLSINRYKEVEYEAVEYDPPKVILERLAELDKEIANGRKELGRLLG